MTPCSLVECFGRFEGKYWLPFRGTEIRFTEIGEGQGAVALCSITSSAYFCLPRVSSGVPAAFCPTPAVSYWLTQRVVCFSGTARACVDIFPHMLPLYHEDGGSTFLWNVFKFLLDFTASRQEHSCVWPDDTPVSTMTHSEYACASGRSFLCFLLIILSVYVYMRCTSMPEALLTFWRRNYFFLNFSTPCI
jgi:hypothetical protein